MTDQKWNDLRPRVLSAIAMLVAGAAAIIVGGALFAVATAIVCGIAIWEISRMTGTAGSYDAYALGGLAAGVVLVASMMPVPLVFVGFILVTAVGAWRATGYSVRFVIYAMWVLVASFGFLGLRVGQDVIWILWLVGIVVVTDIAGYFAGRIIGGPKFWPAISPKKTWSGTVAGWVGAMGVGAIIAATTGMGPTIIVFSIIISFASQMGDIAQSALKRKVGIKDSSNLIPGHGGVFDRFDGMFGAAVFIAVLHYGFGALPWLGGA